jgi:hypothetical protein
MLNLKLLIRQREDQMKLKIMSAFAALALSTQLMAAPSWKVYEIASNDSASTQKIIEATNDFMNSKKGKSYPGGLHLNTVLSNGISQSTHWFVLLMPSYAAIHEWEASLVGDSDISEFYGILNDSSEPVTEYMGNLVKTWGEVSNQDKIWYVTKFYSNDPGKVVSAWDELMGSSLGEKFPGQVAIHATPFGNRNGANNQFSTHMIVSGYESVAELEKWLETQNSDPMWAKTLSAVRDVVIWQGSELTENSLIFDASLDLETYLTD